MLQCLEKLCFGFRHCVNNWDFVIMRPYVSKIMKEIKEDAFQSIHNKFVNLIASKQSTIAAAGYLLTDMGKMPEKPMKMIVSNN